MLECNSVQIPQLYIFELITIPRLDYPPTQSAPDLSHGRTDLIVPLIWTTLVPKTEPERCVNTVLRPTYTRITLVPLRHCYWRIQSSGANSTSFVPRPRRLWTNDEGRPKSSDLCPNRKHQWRRIRIQSLNPDNPKVQIWTSLKSPMFQLWIFLWADLEPLKFDSSQFKELFSNLDLQVRSRLSKRPVLTFALWDLVNLLDLY